MLQRAVRGFAVYDLCVTLPFATPWTAGAMLGVMRWVHEGLAPGGEPMPAFAPVHLFFVALFGVLAVMWALIRILQPTALHGAIDTVGRGLVTSWMVLVLSQGATRILGAFLVMEAAGMFVQGALLLGARRVAAPS
ncbi:hypothetical protein JYK02_22130 [Corallococcus macrosporus]|uniref:Uncharacterized protein n=1 Tax=Corallococcus macrosporus TaxID=35 RepID=A0ABS3DFW9_9BACT|nr:hypothetical protein [Corallococcus macrosporus]